MHQEQYNASRREFLYTGAAALGSFLILKPKTVRGYEANSAVRIGLLGCGGRGTAVATSFAKNTPARIVALADIFPDQLEKAKTTFDALSASLGYTGPDPKLMFRGLDAYRQLAACAEIDSIQISTPPFFHVEHLRAAIEGGKHVYCEKPLGIDIPQTARALELSEKVDGKVSVDVGFQIRSAPPFRELVDRIHNGAIGKIVSISAHYYAPAITYPPRPEIISENELRLRNWNWDLALSGDIIVEQDIHVIDICNWVLNSHPISATATGSRSVLEHWGDNYDNYQVLFTYPNNVHVTLATKQYGENAYFDVSEQVFGSQGFSESPYSGTLRIVGDHPWEWRQAETEESASQGFSATGQFSDNLAQADSEKDKAFVESIVSGSFHNQIATGVETARSAIMARMSARERRPITWDECLRSKQQLHPLLDLKQFS
jgi:myo-inositol 2-dehydrogenase / D-chiro-inositol 1-dehydrogenase